jgi:predicted nucleic acid-binding protein
MSTKQEHCSSPSLFWFEIRNILTMAERVDGLAPARLSSAWNVCGACRSMMPASVATALSCFWAAKHVLSAYDAAYLSLALSRNVALATLDRKLAVAARKEEVIVLGPFAHGD